MTWTTLISLGVVGCSGVPSEPPVRPPAAEATKRMSTGSIPTASEEFVDDHGVRWRLRAEPSPVVLAERASVRLTIEATNTTDAVVDPEPHGGEWRFQGETHPGLTLWFGNGVRATAWSALPPGQTVTDARDVGEHLFEAPGAYAIAYARDGRQATARVTVTE